LDLVILDFGSNNIHNKSWKHTNKFEIILMNKNYQKHFKKVVTNIFLFKDLQKDFKGFENENFHKFSI